jgi:hypothetical protein
MSDEARLYTVVSLFSGGLGLDIGLARPARFEHLASVELDAGCCETIRRNRDAGRIDLAYPTRMSLRGSQHGTRLPEDGWGPRKAPWLERFRLSGQPRPLPPSFSL